MSALAEIRFDTPAGGNAAARGAGTVLRALVDLLELQAYWHTNATYGRGDLEFECPSWAAVLAMGQEYQEGWTEEATEQVRTAEQRLLASVAELGRGGTAALAAWLVQRPVAVQLDPERAPMVQLCSQDDLGDYLQDRMTYL